MKTLLVFIDHPQMGRGKRSDISVHGDMIVLQNSIVWPNTKLALEFRNSKEWFCILGSAYTFWGKLIMTLTMLCATAFMEHYLIHNTISIFFHVT